MRVIDELQFAAAIVLGTAIVLAGCSTGDVSRPAAKEIGLAEFSRNPIVEQEPIDEGRVDSTQDDSADEVLDRSADQQSHAAGESRASHSSSRRTLPPLGAGSAPSTIEPEPGSRVIVDSLVGQVNGRPIYADAFFYPIEDQLRAVADRVGQREFLSQANEIVREHLGVIVRNELFLADARSQLSQEQQQGLFAWMRMMREQTIAQGGGTATGATRRLQDEAGMTLEEYLEARRDDALVRTLQENRIKPRVIVSWRDIEREYQRRYFEFNPPSRMHVSRIRLSTQADAELIAEVRQKFADGADFAEVAEFLGLRDGGAWQVFQIGEDGVDGLELSETIKDHLRRLEVGKTSEPFEIGTSTWWLHLSKIDQPPGRSLYDPEVQRQLHDVIWQRRFTEELNRYISTLFAEGVYDELDKMRERLVMIAYERYGPK